MSATAMAQPPQEGRGGERGQRGQRGNQETAAPRGPAALIAALDANKDGTLSKEEIENASKALMTLDKNGDKALQIDEMMGRPPQRAGGSGAAGDSNAFLTRLMERDKDGDGKISKEEAGEQMGRFFGSMDSDSDGFLSKPELEAMAKRFSGGGQAGAGGGRAGGGGRQGGGGYRAPQPKSKDHRPPFDDN